MHVLFILRFTQEHFQKQIINKTIRSDFIFKTLLLKFVVCNAWPVDRVVCSLIANMVPAEVARSFV